jgi:hypothetical protein
MKKLNLMIFSILSILIQLIGICVIVTQNIIKGTNIRTLYLLLTIFSILLFLLIFITTIP